MTAESILVVDDIVVDGDEAGDEEAGCCEGGADKESSMVDDLY